VLQKLYCLVLDRLFFSYPAGGC